MAKETEIVAAARQLEMLEELAPLADAYTLHIKSANRIWLANAGLLIVLVGRLFNHPADDLVDLLGTSVPWFVFLVGTATIGGLINIAYVVAHLQAYEAGQKFAAFAKALREERNAEKKGGSESDIPKSFLHTSHLLYVSNFNRVYPLSRVEDGAWGATWIQGAVSLIKWFGDLLYFLVGLGPSIIAFWAIVASEPLNAGRSEVMIPVTVVIAVTTFATLRLVWQAIVWNLLRWVIGFLGR